jgi:Cu+-exporting ATPase
VSRILDLVNAAQASKTQIQGLADRVAAIFVPIVLLLAAGNFAVWMIFGGAWEPALLTTIATIVIACPCAMGLATPTAITVAMGTAARLGILFTRASALERAREIRTVLFDKTGTLTEGTPQVAQVVPAAGAGLGPDDLLMTAASVEQFSEHPLARAIVAAAAEKGLSLLEPVGFNSMPGGGVKAHFDDAGGESKKFLACSRSFAQRQGVIIDGGDNDQLEAFAARGASLVLLVDAGTNRLAGVLALRDQLRADASATLQLLQEQGMHVGVLSGDSEGAVEATLQGLAVDFVRAQVRPEEKAAAIAALREQRPGGTIAFVGDGINDAPALAAADLGIAMAGGTDIARSSGDVLLTGNRLAAIPETLKLARRTIRIIRQNLFWAFAYNVAAIPLAMAGVLSPGIAAGAMILSSLTVVGNALRLRR